jgi:hypothetical protein
VLEFEQLLKIFFADHGTKESALAAIGGIREWAEERKAENVAVARSYIAGTGPFPERVAVLAVVGRFISDFADMVGDWAEWASTVVEDWPEDPGLAEPQWDVLETYARRGRERADTQSL